MSALEKIAKRIKNCKKCGLCEGRTNTVPGEGSEKARIFFIGEAPGKNEDLQGRPFVGRSGKLLNEMIEAAGLTREDVFIGNVVKCRPPDNRDPKPEEVEACWKHLEQQVKAINPLLIITLGRHSMDRFLPLKLAISEEHGKIRTFKGIGKKTQVYLPLYHPAVALYNPKMKGVLLKDFKKIPGILKKLEKELS